MNDAEAVVEAVRLFWAFLGFVSFLGVLILIISWKEL